MPITTAQIQSLLRPGMNTVFGMAEQYPTQWGEIFDTHISNKAQEFDMQMRFTGLGAIRPEGSPTYMDVMGQRIQTTYTHRYVGLGFQITRQAMKDNLYQSEFPQMAKALKNSLNQTKEILGANILNTGFVDVIGDGRPLFDTQHPTDNGTFANTFTVQVDLSEASAEAAIIAISGFRDQAGNLSMVKPEKLIVSRQNEFVAKRIFGSEFRPGTNINDINAMYALNSIPQGVRVNQFITLPGFWMIKTNADNGFKHFKREGYETDVYTDFPTDNLLCKAVERYSFGCSNSQSGFASSGGA